MKPTLPLLVMKNAIIKMDAQDEEAVDALLSKLNVLEK
jgi:hypothetical protein